MRSVASPSARSSASAPTSSFRRKRRGRAARRARGAVAPNSSDDAELITGWKHITPEYLWNTELARRTKYLDAFEREEVRDALELAFTAHDGQARKSGEPYITHPVAVAAILADLELDHESLIAGLLHDTVEDTDVVTFESLETRYGVAVRKIVEGETKVSKVSSSLSKDGAARNAPARGGPSAALSSEDVKSEDLAQMFLAMTEEVRIIIVKLADRLHNMRTLEGLKQEKRVKIAKETLLVFAPLAKLLGMYDIKNELEDLAFRYADPEAYSTTVRRLEEVSKVQEPTIKLAFERIKSEMLQDDFLRGHAVAVSLGAKQKEPYGVHRSLRNNSSAKAGAFGANGEAAITEVAQLKVVLHDAQAVIGLSDEARRVQASRICYHVLGVVHAMWPPIPGELRDYLATPKLNGYKALHTVVLPISPGASEVDAAVFPLEVIIRTEPMEMLATKGIACDYELRQQWRMGARRTSLALRAQRRQEKRIALAQEGRKDIDEARLDQEEARDEEVAAADAMRPGGAASTALAKSQVTWLKNIQAWHTEFIDVLSAREFVDTITSDLLGRRVFVFTPKGRALNLPHGATVVDYAFYSDDTNGAHMSYAKVNGVRVDLDHVLSNAEVVEIFTDNDEIPAHMLMRKLRKLRLNAETRSARAKIQKRLAQLGSGAIKELRESLQIEALTLCGEPIPDKVGPGPRTVTYCCCTLELTASDRTGLLAMVSTSITKSGANIDSYTGVKVHSDLFKMTFAIHFDDEELRSGASLKNMDQSLQRLFTEVMKSPEVFSGTFYCDVDAARNAFNVSET